MIPCSPKPCRLVWMALCATLSGLAATAQAAPAEDVARLYALPPEGSAYVRVVNPSNKPLQVQLGAGSKAEALAANARIATDYRALPGGQPAVLKIDGQAVALADPLPRGGFVTLVVQQDQGKPSATQMLDAGAAADGLKAELAAYNLVPGCAAATIALGNGSAVFQNLAEKTRAARAINPVTASLTGRCADTSSAPLALPALKAGDRYSMFLVGTPAAPVLIGVTNRTEPHRAR